MASAINKRDAALQAASPRTATVSLGSAVNITGETNIDITGTANFQGATNYSGVNYCAVFNEDETIAGGVSAIAGASGFGVRGSAGTNGSIGVSGTGGSSSGAEGVRATQGSSGGVALNVVGPMQISSTALVSNLRAQTCVLADNSTEWDGFALSGVSTGSATATMDLTNKPGANSTNKWLTITDGVTTLRIMAWET